jgi:hypothetical protein
VPEHANLPSIDAFVARLGTGSAAGTCSAARGSAGAVAALAAALAVDLAAQVALDSPEWGERGGALAQAAVIRDRSIRLAAQVEQLYGAALDGMPPVPAAPVTAPASGAEDLGMVLAEVAQRLLAVTENASDAAALAELAARAGAPRVRATAVAATMLATSAAEAAAHLVEVNLLVTPDDPRVGRARELVAAAAAAAAAQRRACCRSDVPPPLSAADRRRRSFAAAGTSAGCRSPWPPPCGRRSRRSARGRR